MALKKLQNQFLLYLQTLMCLVKILTDFKRLFLRKILTLNAPKK